MALKVTYCYWCVFVIVNRLPHSSSENVGPLVLLRDPSGGHTMVGQQIVLECSTTFHLDHIYFQWEVPDDIGSDLVKEEPVLRENATSEYITMSRLIIHQSDLRHAGTYRCKVVHKKWNYHAYSEEICVPVYEINEILIAFNTTLSFFDAPEAQIHIYVKGHPKITLTWLDKDNKTIDANSSHYAIYTDPGSNSKGFNYHTVLHFKRINYEDFGQYTVIAESRYQTKSYTVLVNLTENLEASLSTEKMGEYSATLKCVAASYPKPTITWSFTPLGGRVKILEEDNGLQVISYITFNLTEITSVKCFANNSVKYQSLEKTILFVKNGFDASVQRMSSYFHYREMVPLFCAVSSDKYVDEIIWYHNGKNMQDDYYTLYSSSRRTRHLDKIVYEVSLEYILEDQMGNYTCEVLTRTGEIQSKNVTIVPKYIPNFYPTMVLQQVSNKPVVQGENIALECRVTFYAPVSFKWERNSKTVVGPIYKNKIIEKHSSTNNFTSQLTVPEANLNDSGLYVCNITSGLNSTDDGQVSSENFLWIPVFGVNDSIITFDEDKSLFNETNVEVQIFLTVYPKPTITWYDNHGEEILPNSSKYLMQSSPSQNIADNNYKIKLIFKNIVPEDFGNYTVVVDNHHETKSLSILVNVTEPSTSVETYKFFKNNMSTIIQCSSVGSPEPILEWYFKGCTLESCTEYNSSIEKFPEKKQPLFVEKHGLRKVSYISVNLSESGIFRCVSRNSFGESYTDKVILNAKHDFDIFAKKMYTRKSVKMVDVLPDSKTAIMCAISTLSYKKEIQFLHNAKIIHQKYVTTYDFYNTFVAKINVVYDIVAPDKYYTCNALTKDGFLKSRSMVVNSEEVPRLQFLGNETKGDCIQIKMKSTCRFYCYADSFPKPTIKWFHNLEDVEPSEKIRVLEDGQILEIQNVDVDDEGTYSCELNNGFSIFHDTKSLSIRPADNLSWFTVLIPLLVVALLVAGFFIIKLRKDSKLARELKLAGLADFEKGGLENLNPNLRIEDQADLLPYDKKWEIPRDNIKIGTQLGSGAFGIVLKAEVVDFFPDESSKTVAVKTTKSTSGFECIKALASELKIMAHLGKHINVVNLLGACTKNIAKRELYVVVEFCHFGCLRDYMLRYSRNFIDQRDTQRDEFDWSIGPESMENCTKRQNNGYVNLIESGNGETKVKFSRKSDCQEPPIFIYTKDFLIWAFQIARGMEYLSSRRVVHGDLAARNVLLADNNVVKISDFGLSKKMYQYGNYVKIGEGLLPVKWMAVETIKKGDTPYPGVPFDETFCTRLIEGYRMDAPDTVTGSIYNMMIDCWDSDPLMRPSFANLAERIGSLLDEPLRNHYIDMNKAYMLMNKCGKEDYLTMVSPPTFDNVVSTCTSYVNCAYTPENVDSED